MAKVVSLPFGMPRENLPEPYGRTEVIEGRRAYRTVDDGDHTEWDEMPTDLPVPDGRKVVVGDKLVDIQADELDHYEMILSALKHGFRRKHLNVSEICQLGLTTQKVLEGRRKLLFPDTGGPKKFNPYDT